MTPTQLGDPPRVSPVQQYDTFVEPDVHQQPVAATTHDESNIHVHRPRHAVVIFFLVFCVCCFILYFITNNCYVCFFFFHLLGWLCSNC